MAIPNLSNIDDINVKINKDINKAVKRFDGTEDEETKKILEQVVDSLAALNKELKFVFNNIGFENMPVVKTEIDGITTKIQDNTGDIATLKESGHELSQKIEGVRLEIDGEITNLKELIDKETGDLNEDLLDKLDKLSINVSNISQKADSINSTVEQQEIKVNQTIKDVLKNNQDINNLNNEVAANASVIATHTSKIEQNARNINLKVSSSDYTGRNLMSMINLDSSSVKIKSEKIQLEGQTRITTADGSATLFVENRSGYAGLEFQYKVGGNNLRRAMAMSYNPYYDEVVLELPRVAIQGDVDRSRLYETNIW